MNTQSTSKDQLQRIWSQMSGADREVILGHSREALDANDRRQLAQVLETLGRRHRRS